MEQFPMDCLVGLSTQTLVSLICVKIRLDTFLSSIFVGVVFVLRDDSKIPVV